MPHGAKWGLTLRSIGAPTACHAGHQALGLRPILRLLSSAPCRRRPLSSNVRPRRTRITINRSVIKQPTPSIRMATAVQVQPVTQLELRARFALAAEAAQSVWSRPPKAAIKDGRVSLEVLQYEKDHNVMVGRCPFSAARPARISLSHRSCPDLWRWPTAKRKLQQCCTNCDFKCRLSGQRRHLPPARPNQSLKRTANGRPPGPRGGSVYHPPRGPGALPSAAA